MPTQAQPRYISHTQPWVCLSCQNKTRPQRLFPMLEDFPLWLGASGPLPKWRWTQAWALWRSNSRLKNLNSEKLRKYQEKSNWCIHLSNRYYTRHRSKDRDCKKLFKSWMPIKKYPKVWVIKSSVRLPWTFSAVLIWSIPESSVTAMIYFSYFQVCTRRWRYHFYSNPTLTALTGMG